LPRRLVAPTAAVDLAVGLRFPLPIRSRALLPRSAHEATLARAIHPLLLVLTRLAEVGTLHVALLALATEVGTVRTAVAHGAPIVVVPRTALEQTRAAAIVTRLEATTEHASATTAAHGQTCVLARRDPRLSGPHTRAEEADRIASTEHPVSTTRRLQIGDAQARHVTTERALHLSEWNALVHRPAVA